MTIYRYGRLAWFWRILGFGALAAGAAALYGAVHFRDPWFVAMAGPLVLPACLLGWMVAARVETREDTIHVTTLCFLPRRIPSTALGRPRPRFLATAMLTRIPAPRLWVPVDGGLPLYLDLLAHIPDRPAFDAVFPIPPVLLEALEED